MNVYNAHAVDEGSDCTQSNNIIVASVVTSMITTIVVLAISIAIHTGVWFYRKSHSDLAVCHVHQGKDSDDVYATVDDKAYGTNKH